MKTHPLAFCAAALFASLVGAATAQGLEISWFTVDGGGAMFTTGGNFELSATIGQADAGVMAGGGFDLVGGFWGATAATASPAPGDCDADGDVDLTDYTDLEACLNGPAESSPAVCDCADLDGDGDADLADFAEFQLEFTRP